MRIHHIALIASDYQTSKRFYTETLGLTVLAEDIGDVRTAVTRFVLVSRPGELPAPTGADKTTLVAYMREDHAGALLDKPGQAPRGASTRESLPARRSGRFGRRRARVLGGGHRRVWGGGDHRRCDCFSGLALPRCDASQR